MPDYLSCGACHAEFEVVDFYLFLDHKVSNCHVGYPKNGSDRLSGAESVLECSKCLRKCRTPWALLQHLQTEHCLSLARTLLLPTNGAPAPFLSVAGGRQRSLMDQSNVSEACTQTTRSCLKRQVCPYEEGLPDDCCLKASKEQRASDSGCCCMDSFGANGGGACSGACGGGGGGGGDKNTAKRQSDCCLAVPKKRRLLTAAAADATAAGKGPTATSAALLTATASADVPDGCCGQQPDCVMLRPPVAKRSAECQTDFVVSLLDDLDVDMLLEDAGVDVPSSLVGDIDGHGCSGGGVSIASIASIVDSSSSTVESLPTSLGRRYLAPAPSKAIQTVSRIVSQQPLLPPAPPPPPQQQQQVILADFYSTATLRYQQPDEERPSQQYPHQQHPSTSVSLSLPPLIMTDSGGGSSDGVEVSLTSRQQAPTSVSCSRPRPQVFDSHSGGKDLRFKCTLCPRTFRQNIHLRKHVMSQHSHSKPHKCPSCEYTTVEKSHLTVHIRKHTGERPYSCRVCDYSTAQNCTLKAHYLRKHPGNIVHCAKCDLEFVTEHERDKHERSCSLDLLAVAGAVDSYS